jgi:hypothetical protein
MNANTLAQLTALKADANALRKNIDSLARRLDMLIAMEMMFESGRSVTEVAKSFDITVSAASHRKRIWQTKSGAPA